MLENFKKYLIQEGYSEYTPSGNPSTVYDYAKRVQRICTREEISYNELAANICFYVEKYDSFGDEADFGSKSHNAYINALRRFNEFTLFLSK
jgi:hypothetical protein